jgi:aspartate-semialdehyde dehydrogenase
MERQLPPLRIALVGASSLRGKELKSVLEDRAFPPPSGPLDLVLLDSTVLAGTLAEAAGEPTFVKPMEAESFSGARFVFFAGNAEETRANWKMARDAGATIIDLTGALEQQAGALAWIPNLDTLLSPPTSSGTKGQQVFSSPSAPVIIACTLTAALAKFSPARIAILFFPPVSEREQPGVDELENQATALLSFKPFPQQVFDAQVAFNLLSGYGRASKPGLGEIRSGISSGVAKYLAGRLKTPALQLVQAPVFFGYAFAAAVEFGKEIPAGEIESSVAAAGVHFIAEGEAKPTNVAVAGEEKIQIARPERDPSAPESVWLWGVADNLRLPAANGVRIAEELLAPKI